MFFSKPFLEGAWTLFGNSSELYLRDNPMFLYCWGCHAGSVSDVKTFQAQQMSKTFKDVMNENGTFFESEMYLN